MQARAERVLAVWRDVHVNVVAAIAVIRRHVTRPHSVIRPRKSGTLLHLWVSAACFSLVAAASAHAADDDIARHLTGLPFVMPELTVPVFPDVRHAITEFGAVPDGRTLNTRAFAEAIAACRAAGGGSVIVPAGVWRTGPIRLESAIRLHLERGALVQFSSDLDDYPLIAGLDGTSSRFMITPPIHAYRAVNVAITGPGIIDGAGEFWRYVKREKLTEREWKELTSSGGAVTPDGTQWWPSKEAMEGEAALATLEKAGKAPTIADFARVREYLRPDMVRLVQCENILIDGPTFRNSPKFNVHLIQSERIIVRNTTIQTAWNAQNGDGLDLAACRTVLVYNTTVDAGDDAICLKPSRVADRQSPGPACENIVISDCVVYRGHGGFVIGSEGYGGARNIAVRNCTFVGTDVGIRFKSARGRGGLIERIFVTGIRMRGIADQAILFDMSYGEGNPETGARRVKTAASVDATTPQYREIMIDSIVCVGAGRALLVNGLPEMPVRGVRLSNLSISSRKGVLCVDAEGITIDRANLTVSEGPAVDLHQARAITLRNVSPSGAPRPRLRVSGTGSDEIVVEGDDPEVWRGSLEAAEEVRRDAVRIMEKPR